jgi:hypothetical protein
MDNPDIDSDGDKWWYDSDGEFHRTDGPAVVRTNGYKAWFQHGVRHRTAGPAVEYADGAKEWWQHGNYHRDDGPAVENTNGHQRWWLNDQHMSFDEWLDKVKMSDEDKVMMKLKYG